VELAKFADPSSRVTSAFRTYALQQELYRKYREGLSRYPAARPGHSAHEYGYAIDLTFTIPDARDVVRNIWVSYGGNLGNDDEVHFEFPNWRAMASTQTAAEPAPSQALGTTGKAWDQLANLLLSFVPYARGIMSIASIASALAEAFGYDQSVAVYYLSNPYRASVDLTRWLENLTLESIGMSPDTGPTM
jgi:hypothetical protein